jgi:hypothetical protein
MQRISTGYKARPVFVPFHRRKQRWAIVVAHRRAGKTVSAIHDMLDHALRTDKPDALYIFGAPTRDQAKAVAWTYLKRAVAPLPGIKVNEAELSVKLHNGSVIRLYGLDTSYERLRGLRLDGIILDEVADIDANAWPNVIRPALSDREGWAVWIGTPKGRDAFYQKFAEAVSKPEEYYTQVLRASETGLVKQEELDAAKGQMPESVYNREFECSFDEPGINQLIGGDTIKLAQERDTAVANGPRLLGVDVARFGDDRTVIAWRDGDVVIHFTVLRGVDTMQTVGAVTLAASEFKPDAIMIDVIGIGSGVADRLRQLRYPVIDVNAGNKAMNDAKFFNLRAEMWFKMADWLKSNGKIPKRDDLDLDLTAVTYKFDTRNRLQLESKEDIKKRLEISPDLGDALALTFAQPIAHKDMRRVLPTQAEDYDPFTFRNKRPERAEEWSPF